MLRVGRPATGEGWDSPYDASTKHLALASGNGDGWREASVDLAAEYRARFGRPPPRLLGIGLMTDADDSCGTARAFYADFAFEGPEAASDTPGSGEHPIH